jgi:hypothetical protein
VRISLLGIVEPDAGGELNGAELERGLPGGGQDQGGGQGE